MRVNTRYINCTRVTAFDQELCGSRGGRLGPNKPTVSVDVKQHSTNSLRFAYNYTGVSIPCIHSHAVRVTVGDSGLVVVVMFDVFEMSS